MMKYVLPGLAILVMMGAPTARADLSRSVSIPSQNGFVVDYGEVEPESLLVLSVGADPGCEILSGSARGGGWSGGPTRFTNFIPPDARGARNGMMMGTFRCESEGGAGPVAVAGPSRPERWHGRALARVERRWCVFKRDPMRQPHSDAPGGTEANCPRILREAQFICIECEDPCRRRSEIVSGHVLSR